MAVFLKTLLVLCLAVLAGCALAAQAVAPTDAATLHVYVNRIQIPVLVLSQYGRPLRPIPESSFMIHVDGLGTFRPSHVRLQGDDPLEIAIVVDASDPNETMWHDLPRAMERLLAVLKPDDRVVLYGLTGCSARRFLPENAPLNQELVRAGVAAAMTMRAKAPAKGKDGACPSPVSVAEVVGYAAARMTSFRGRRMIVTIEANPGAAYNASMDRLKLMLNAESIMLMPVVHDNAFAAMPMTYLPQRGRVPAVNAGIGNAYGALAELSEYSGGRVRYISSGEFTGSLKESVELARGRYILEFPRPDSLGAGRYQITVSDGHPRDFVRASGISVPVATPGEKTTVVAAVDAGPSVPPSTDGVAPPAAAPASVALPVSAPHEGSSPLPAPAAVVPLLPAPPAPDPTDITGELKPAR